MKLRKHRRRQGYMSAHTFVGRHLGVWRGWVEWTDGYQRYIRYPYSTIPKEMKDVDADCVRMVDEEFWNLI
ncbi:hypothetical protein [Paraburkholderia tropica]|uniref:hypothetical protein n=1 Tax=Paraburkholderia tropica TaxID=92647 RepID=UPI003D2D58B9